MKQKKIKKLADKLHITLDEENRAILTLKVTDNTNFLSPFYFEKPVISNDVAEYLKLNKRLLLWKIGLTIHIKSNVITDKEKELYAKAIKEYFKTSIIYDTRKKKTNYILSTILFLIGILVFAFMFLLDYLFADSLGLWKEVIDVIAWVFIWEAIDIAFIERLEHSNQVKMANNIIESKIVFSKLDDN